MPNLPDSVWVFAGSVVAAVIVLFSGWLQQQISRASTVSGYRQKWIQDIRKVFSEYVEELEKLADLAACNGKENCSLGGMQSIQNDTRKVRERRNYLRLFTNPKEGQHTALLENAKNLEQYLTDTVRKDLKMNQYDDNRNKLVDDFQDILKEEWDRVKMGEIRWSMRKLCRRITRRSNKQAEARPA